MRRGENSALLRSILNKPPRISTPDQSQNLTLQSVKRYQRLQSGNTAVTILNVAGYPLQKRRHFYIEISNAKYNLLVFLITAIYQ
jgi:hypothetical protein